MDGYYARGWLILDDLYLNQLSSGMVVLKSKKNRHSESENIDTKGNLMLSGAALTKFSRY